MLKPSSYIYGLDFSRSNHVLSFPFYCFASCADLSPNERHNLTCVHRQGTKTNLCCDLVKPLAPTCAWCVVISSVTGIRVSKYCCFVDLSSIRYQLDLNNGLYWFIYARQRKIHLLEKRKFKLMNDY